MKPTNQRNEDVPDWRTNAIVELSEDVILPGASSITPKGTRLNIIANIQLTKKKTLTITIPNATAIFLNASFNSFLRSQDIRRNNAIDETLRNQVSFRSDTESFDFIENLFESIVLAYTSLEAFANELIPEDFVYTHFKSSDVILEISNKEKIERHLSTEEKLNVILPEVLKCKSPKGTHIWKNYRLLKEARDKIIHAKTKDRRFTLDELNSLWSSTFAVTHPHEAAKRIIDYFVNHMSKQPDWHRNYRNAKHI